MDLGEFAVKSKGGKNAAKGPKGPKGSVVVLGGLNPAAAGFSFNPTAAAFVPGGGSGGAPAS